MTIVLIFLIYFFLINRFNSNLIVGLSFYVFFVILCPYLNLGSYYIRIEHIFFPIMMFFVINKKKEFKIPKISILLLLLFTYGIFASLFYPISRLNSSIGYVTAFNFFKYPILIIIGYNILVDFEKLTTFLRYYVYTSIFTSILAIGQVLRINFFDQITLNLYNSPFRDIYSGGLDIYNNNINNLIFRSISVFENVSFYAVYLICIVIINIELIVNDRMKFKKPIYHRLLQCLLFINLIAGLATSSSTFYFGILIIGLVSLFRFGMKIIIPISISFIVFTVIFANKIYLYINNLNYIITSLIDGSKIYRRHNLSLRPEANIEYIFEQKWLVGNGFRFYENNLINDSFYLQFYTYFGTIGNLITVLFFISIYLTISKIRDETKYMFFLIITIMLFSGIGSNVFSTLRHSEFLFLIIGGLFHYKYNIKNKLQ